LPGLRIAVVEDNPLDADLLCRRLKRVAGATVTGVHASAEEALRAIPKSPPDVVLMDIHLPGRSGIECARLLKRDVPAVRILVLTNDDTKAVLDATLKSGVDGYLVKPASAAKLSAALAKVCAGQFALSDGMLAPLVELARKPGAFAPHPSLSRRENDIMARVVAGATDKEFAGQCGIAAATVSRHLHHIYGKLGVHTRAQAVAKLRVGP
jgi:DNA-binding NarL/FixJ family response regulator